MNLSINTNFHQRRLSITTPSQLSAQSSVFQSSSDDSAYIPLSASFVTPISRLQLFSELSPSTPTSLQDQIARFSRLICFLIDKVWNPFKPVKASYLSLDTTDAFVLFIQQILQYTKIEFSVVILALKYMECIKNNYTASTGLETVGISQRNEAKLFIVALMLASKYTNDTPLCQKSWSRLTGIELNELSAIEIAFLGKLNYALHVNQEEYRAYCAHVHKMMRMWKNLVAVNITSPTNVGSSEVTNTKRNCVSGHPSTQQHFRREFMTRRFSVSHTSRKPLRLQTSRMENHCEEPHPQSVTTPISNSFDVIRESIDDASGIAYSKMSIETLITTNIYRMTMESPSPKDSAGPKTSSDRYQPYTRFFDSIKGERVSGSRRGSFTTQYLK